MLGCNHGADRNTTAKPLRKRPDIRPDTGLFKGKHCAATANTGLNLIKHQQNIFALPRRR